MSKKAQLPPIQLIKTHQQLVELVEKLIHEPMLAVDTESNSLYAYQEQVCLIQISTATQDYIVDPLVIKDVQPLGVLFAKESIETIFHAAEYDVMTLKRDFGFEFANIFDTMIASRILGLPQVGLGDLLHTYLGITVDKRHQRDDWGKRPLPKDSLRYAQMDTHYLLQLRDILCDMLKAKGHIAEADEMFAEQALAPASEVYKFDEHSFWKLGIPNHLSHNQLKVLHELFIWRDELACLRNRPAFKVIGNKTLLSLAQRMPSNKHELRAVFGMSQTQIRRYGDQLLKAVWRGKTAKTLPSQPRHEAPDPIVTERYAALHLWRKERAIARGVGSDVILSKQAMWSLAHKTTDNLEELATIQGIGTWRIKTYGEEILDVLQTFKQLEG